MILDDIREMKKQMDRLEERILSYSQIGAIRYDKEPVQCSNVGSVEADMLDMIECKDQWLILYKKYVRMVRQVNMKMFTSRQAEFIQLFYFQGKSITESAKLMNVGFNAVCKLKNRINSALGVAMYI